MAVHSGAFRGRAMVRPMRFGAFIPQGWRHDLVGIDRSEHWATMTRVAATIEETGYESGWVYDHLHPVPEPTQEPVYEAPAVFVVAGVVARTSQRYGQRALRYVLIEAGHVGQNLLLQAVALGLGGVPIGAFYDEDVRAVLGLPADNQVLYIIPVGHPR